MGISWILLIRAVSITMKFLALASSLLAAVSGQYLGYAGYPYAAHAIVGLKSAPCVNAANVPVPCAAGYYGKRDAEADPQLLVAGVPFGSSTGLDPITQGLDAVTQGVALPYHAGVYGYGYYGKRDADAEPEADADALYGYYGYARPYAYGYRSYGYPYRYGYYGKRSADAEPEAEADPALLYTTSHVVNPVTSYVAGSPLVYNTHPVTSVNNVPVVKAAVNTVPVVNTVYNAAVHTPV